MNNHSPAADSRPRDFAVIFDLDGVIADTAPLHFQSWRELADEHQIPFDAARYDTMRGLARNESLRVFLGEHAARFTAAEQAEIARRKNEAFLASVERMTPQDILPGIADLIEKLRALCTPLAVASSSRNAEIVLRRLGLFNSFNAVIDANAVAPSKPDPQIFLAASAALGVAPARCIVLEDSEAGVAAARTAGMKVIGIGPPERVGAADRMVKSTARLALKLVHDLLGSPEKP